MSNRIIIHPDRLTANLKAVQNALPEGTAVIHVVKANAYGHGLETAVMAAGDAGVSRFAVAYVHEAERVRKAAPDGWILIMGVVRGHEVDACFRLGAVPVVVDEEHGQELAAAVPAGACLDVHLKIDTGMNRLGWAEPDPVPAIRRLAADGRLRITGVMSHLASSGPGGLAETQAERFRGILDALEPDEGRLIHFSNSQGLQFGWGQAFPGVRVGLLPYGYPTPGPEVPVAVRPVMEWRAEVFQVKDGPAGSPVGYDSTFYTARPTRIATLSAGYADGYLRALSNCGVVVLRGRRCPVIGRVSMNWITVDAGASSPVRRGDEALLIGEEDGASVDAAELANLAETIPYEILTRAGGASP